MTRSNSLFCSHVNGISTTNTYSLTWCLIKQSVSVIPCTQCIICVWQLFAFFKSQFTIFIRKKWLQSPFLDIHMYVRFSLLHLLCERDCLCVCISQGIRVVYKILCNCSLHLCFALYHAISVCLVSKYIQTPNQPTTEPDISHLIRRLSIFKPHIAIIYWIAEVHSGVWCIAHLKWAIPEGSPSDFCRIANDWLSIAHKKPVFFSDHTKTHTHRTCNMQQRSGEKQKTNTQI